MASHFIFGHWQTVHKGELFILVRGEPVSCITVFNLRSHSNSYASWDNRSIPILSRIKIYILVFYVNLAKKLTLQIGPSQMTLFSPDTITLLPRAGLTWPSAVMVEPASAWWSITDLLILSLYYHVQAWPDLQPWWSSACMVIYQWSPDSITLLYHVQAWPDLCLSAWIFALP